MNSLRRSLLRGLGLAGAFGLVSPSGALACLCRRWTARRPGVVVSRPADPSSFVQKPWVNYALRPCDPLPTVASSNLRSLPTITRGGDPINIILEGSFEDADPTKYLVRFNDTTGNATWGDAVPSSVVAGTMGTGRLFVNDYIVATGSNDGTDGSINITIKYTSGLPCYALLDPSPANGGYVTYTPIS